MQKLDGSIGPLCTCSHDLPAHTSPIDGSRINCLWEGCKCTAWYSTFTIPARSEDAFHCLDSCDPMGHSPMCQNYGTGLPDLPDTDDAVDVTRQEYEDMRGLLLLIGHVVRGNMWTHSIDYEAVDAAWKRLERGR